MKYTKRELALIKSLASKKLRAQEIAARCNARFHDGRPIRTARGIGFALLDKLKLSNSRFKRRCLVCSNWFKTSWPNSRYCGDACKSVTDREYANGIYRKNPADNLLKQSKRARERMRRRREIILAHFGDKCGRCKQTFHQIVYDLHHPNGKKSRKDNPSRIIRLGTDEQFRRLLAETQMLCANCHRLTHYELGNWAPGRKDI